MTFGAALFFRTHFIFIAKSDPWDSLIRNESVHNTQRGKTNINVSPTATATNTTLMLKTHHAYKVSITDSARLMVDAGVLYAGNMRKD